MRASTKKRKNTAAKHLHGSNRPFIVAMSSKKKQRRKHGAQQDISPLNEWQLLSHVDADTIIHMIRTPLRVNQAMQDAKMRHSLIPQVGR